MPIQRCRLNNKPGYKWGKQGKCYVYDPKSKSSETVAKNKARDQGIATGEYYGWLVERIQKINKFSMDKISFDFDGTLTEASITRQAEEMIAEGNEIYILTAHSQDDKDPVMEKAEELGIPDSHVIFVENTLDKWKKAKELGISVHYDDNADVIKSFKDNNLRAIKV